MGEIDFDELDKAVSNLMGQPAVASSSDSTAPNTTSDASVATMTAEQAGAIAESDMTKTESTSSDGQDLTSAATPLAQRRGQFMDVMHPSAKMRNQQSQSPRPRVTRQAPEITPRPEAEAATTAVNLEMDTADDLSTLDDSSSFNNLNELRDTETFTTEPAASADRLELQTDDQPEVPSFDPIEMSDDSPEPLSSPFLADAKVEKRPLGTAASHPTSDINFDLEMTPLDVSDPTASQVELKTDDTPPSNPLPAELSSDVMQVESNGATEPVKATSSQQPQPKPVTNDTASTLPAQTSIPTQYTAAKPKVPSAESGTQTASMYDLGDGPLKVPAKKKSSWPIVIGAIALIVLGVAGSMGLFLLNHS